MSKSESAADGGLQRLILVDVIDIDRSPIAGAKVSLFVDNEFAGQAVTPSGRATFQISSNDVELSVEASYQNESKRVALARNADQVEVQLEVDASVHVVILIHGINTRAQWLGIVGPALQARGLVPAPAGYGVYGVLRFLLPFDWLRKRAIASVENRFGLQLP